MSLAERTKRCVIGTADRFPADNLAGDANAACEWDCYRRATMLEDFATYIFDHNVQGDFMEAGVFKGGVAIVMAALLLQDRSNNDRKMWMADSFVGLPRLDLGRIRDPTVANLVRTQSAAAKWHPGRFAASKQIVKRNLYNCLPEATGRQFVKFIGGFFNESLPGPVKQLALLRIDADMYTSITDVLERAYDRMSSGGFVVFDDYKFGQARLAIEDFRQRRGVRAPLQFYNETLDVMAYWRVPYRIKH